MREGVSISMLLSRRLNLRLPRANAKGSPPPLSLLTPCFETTSGAPAFPPPYRFPFRSVFSPTLFFSSSSRHVTFSVPNRLRSIPFPFNRFRARTEKHRGGAPPPLLQKSRSSELSLLPLSLPPCSPCLRGLSSAKSDHSRTYAKKGGVGGPKPYRNPQAVLYI